MKIKNQLTLIDFIIRVRVYKRKNNLKLLRDNFDDIFEDKEGEKMNRPDELIKELENFSATEYGNELSITECHIIANYIKSLETALDKACEAMTNRVNIDKGDGYPTLHFTKEECEEALMNICSSNSKIKDRKVFYKLINEHDELSNQLVELSRDIKSKDEYITGLRNYITQIEREFKDNPPLKFYELKEGMWVWDNKYKEYCYIYFIGGKYPHRKYIDNCESDSEFEENRFYRYEVNNDE